MLRQIVPFRATTTRQEHPLVVSPTAADASATGATVEDGKSGDTDVS